MNFVLKHLGKRISSEKFTNRKTCVTNIGYVPIRKQVALMTAAGERLQQSRNAAFYDFPDGEIDETVRMDPTVNEGFDILDASLLASDLQQSYKGEVNTLPTEPVKTAVSGALEQDTESK